jgi:hypothetical protein
MNSLESVLISQRVQYIVEKLLENFNVLWLADYQRIIDLERLSTGRLSLEDGTQIIYSLVFLLIKLFFLKEKFGY